MSAHTFCSWGVMMIVDVDSPLGGEIGWACYEHSDRHAVFTREVDAQEWARYMGAKTNACRYEVRVYPGATTVEEKKESGGKKYDGDKLLYRLRDALAMREWVAVLSYGAVLYGPDNWRGLDALEERYLDALERHVEAHRMGETFDEDSGLLHLAHAMCCVGFLLAHKLATTPSLRDTFPTRFKRALANARCIRAERESKSEVVRASGISREDVERIVDGKTARQQRREETGREE